MELVSLFRYKENKKSNVTLAKKGSKEAFVTLIKENECDLYKVAKGILNSQADIEDAIQSTIIKAYEKIGTLKNEDFFKTWLIRILINESNSIIRKNKKLIYIEENQQNGNYSDKYEDIDLKNAINSLNEKLKEVTVLFYFQDLSQKDIAKQLGINEITVRTRLSRARKIIYDQIKDR